jgi:hypothetical protein
MKTLLRASLLVIPFFAVPSLAHAIGIPCCQFEAGFGCRFNNTGMKGNCGAVAGPWYSYFPYNDYWHTPAPVFGWPYLPQQPATPVPAPHAAGPQVPGPQANEKEPKMPQQPQPQSRYFPPREVQPVGYFAPAPSYWYGR